MSSHVKIQGLTSMPGAIDLTSDDIRIVPCMTNTTADTEDSGIATVTDFSTLDEFDGSGYSSGGVQLANEAMNKDDPNERGEFDADDIADPSWGDGTRQIAGILIIEWDTSLGASIPLGWIDDGGFPMDGSSFNGVEWSAQGIIQFTKP